MKKEEFSLDINDRPAWGALLAVLREHKGYSLQELSTLSKVPLRTVKAMESGKGPLRLKQLMSVLPVLGYQLKFLDISGPKKPAKRSAKTSRKGVRK